MNLHLINNVNKSSYSNKQDRHLKNGRQFNQASRETSKNDTVLTMLAMKLLPLILSLLPVCGYTSTLIGKTVPPFPEDLETKHGACIAHELGNDRFCEFAVSDLRKKGKTPFALIVKKEIGRSGKSAIWQVTDQIKWPSQLKGTYVSLGVCSLNGIIDHSIVAVVVDSDAQWHVAIDWAVKIDLKNGKFLPISIEGVRCENEGWGV